MNADTFPRTGSFVQQQSNQHTDDQAELHMLTSSPGPKTYQTTNIDRKPHINQDELSQTQMFHSSPEPKEFETRAIQRQPTFAPIRTSVEPERPSTAPIEWPSDMTRKMLPPRRELPFPKPSSSPASKSGSCCAREEGKGRDHTAYYSSWTYKIRTSGITHVQFPIKR
jgi:hypothetical protein